MRILKEVEIDVSVNGEDIPCLVYVHAYYSQGTRYGMTETFLDEIEIDEIFSLDNTTTVSLKTIDNIGRIKDLLFDSIANETVDDWYQDESNDLFDLSNIEEVN